MIRGKVGETGIAYCVDGPSDGPVILFSNSLGTDHRLWDAQVPAVVDRYRVIRYEACGHGVSDRPRARVTIDQLGQDVVSLLEHLQVKRGVVCGCSMGGVIALWLAANRPDCIAGAVLANTGAKLGTDDGWNTRIAAVRAGGTAAIRDMVLGRFLTATFRARHPDTAAHIAGMIEATDDDGYIAACEALRDVDLREAARTVGVPVMIIASELDESTPPALSHELYESIGNSELVMIPAAAHLSNVERPKSFNSALLRFLARVSPT